MSDEMEYTSPLDIALSFINGYDPPAVANALPNLDFAIPDFHSNYGLQAQLILGWNADFASQVLETWKPPESTWTEVLGRSEDAAHAVKLAMSALDTAGVKRAIAAAGRAHGGAKQVMLMNALRNNLELNRRTQLSSKEAGALGSPFHAPHHRLPTTLSVNVGPPTPLLTTPAQAKTTTNPHNVPPYNTFPPTMGINSSGSSVPKSPSPGQRVSGGSSKENVRLPVYNSLKSTNTRQTSKQQSQGPVPDFQKLFAEDDARRAQATASNIASPQLPQRSQPLHDVTNAPKASMDLRGSASETENRSPSHRTIEGLKTRSTSPLHPVPEEDEDHLGSSALSLPHESSPPATSAGNEDQSGIDRADPAPPREPATFPGVDGFSTEGGGDEDEYEDDDSQGGFGSEFDKEQSDRSERGEDSEGDYDQPEVDEDLSSNEDERSDGDLDPATPNPWTWSRKTNDEKVELWGVEDLIEQDPLSTAPVRTKWMYEARKGDMSDEEYLALLQEEHEKFMKIPVACRAAVGQMWYRDSKLDWELRVFWAPLVYEYALLKDKCEAAEEDGDKGEVKQNEANRRTLVTEAIAQLMERFPDCSPDHELRRIQERYGKKELSNYIARFRNKFTTDAGRMKILYQKNVGKVGIIGAGVSMSTLLKILDRKKINIAFHLWGRSKDGGKEVCDGEIEEEMAEWEEENPAATPYQANQHRIKVIQDVRKTNFEALTDGSQEKWTKRAKTIHKPTTVEEEECFVEATLPHVVDLLKLLAERGNMHFVLLASSSASCDVPIIVQEIGRKTVGQNLFLSANDGLGARVRAGYIDYALQRFGGGVDKAVIRMEAAPAGDLEDDVDQEESLRGTEPPKRKPKNQPPNVSPVIPPFKPNLSETKSVQKMVKAISDFIIMGVEKLYRIRATWDKLTREAGTYILVDRMPMDPDVPGQRLQLQKPAAMTFARLRTFFKFLVASYDGSLPDHECFRFRFTTPAKQLRRRNSPSTRERQASRSRKKTKRARKEQEEIIEGFDNDDYEATLHDIDETIFEDALTLPTTGKGQPKTLLKGRALRVVSPPQSSDKTHPPRIMPSSGLKGNHPSASKNSVTTEAPDKPRPRPRPRPKSAIAGGTDKLSHPLLLPTDGETVKIWKETKQYLDLWGENMTHVDEEFRKMPYLGLSGVKPSIDLPAAIYSSISIIQLWTVFQADGTDEFDVTLPPNLDLKTVKPAHHISKAIARIMNSNEPLPSAGFIHTQVPVSPDAGNAFFLVIEAAVERFLDGMVASEQTVLESNLNLLQGMRLASYMATTGSIRDEDKRGLHTQRTSAISDRFVQIVAAIAFARYLSLVLGRVAKLYAETSDAPDTKIMWNKLESLWGAGCASLARALVARRSDVFCFQTQSGSLPSNFRALTDFVFELRPWWTPGSKGVPELVNITNKQAVASEAFFRHLKGINWTRCSFIERGQILLLIFIAAIQIETGRVKRKDGKPEAESPARLLADSLSSLRKLVEDSGEDGPTEEQILIPNDQVLTWLNKWEMECQVLPDDGTLNPPLADGNPSQTGAPPTKNSEAVTSTPPSAPLAPLTETSIGDGNDVEMAGSQSQLSFQPGIPPTPTENSKVPTSTPASVNSIPLGETSIGDGNAVEMAGSQLQLSFQLVAPPAPTESSTVPTTTPASVNSVPPGDKSLGDKTTAGSPASQPQVCEPQAQSMASEDTSHVSYEEEDPTFPSANKPGTSASEPTVVPPTSQVAALVPAVRHLEDAPLPPAKRKRGTREVETGSLDAIEQGPRKLRSATIPIPQPPQNIPSITPGRASAPRRAKAPASGDAQGTANTRKTRSAGTAPSNAGRGRRSALNGTAAATPSRQGSSKRGR
ncbi:hypothetical protein FRC01_009688 [Tulasnella sp. 417]|nr:hypothetical protein FRC01_009688 [Tulasnella sp. 417]